MKHWPEKVDVFVSSETKREFKEWCTRARVSQADAGRVAFALFLERYRDFQPGDPFPSTVARLAPVPPRSERP